MSSSLFLDFLSYPAEPSVLKKKRAVLKKKFTRFYFRKTHIISFYTGFDKIEMNKDI